MIFLIDNLPPTVEVLETERALIQDQINSIATRDTVITFILIMLISLGSGMAVFWSTDNVRYAGIVAAVFPVVGIVMSMLGVTKVVGFRSAARRLTDLSNDLIALNPVSGGSIDDINTLRAKYKRVDEYQSQLEKEKRTAVNGELAMYWEFDASTSAKSARGRDFLDRARESAETSTPG